MQDQTALPDTVYEDTDSEEENSFTPLESEELEYWQEVFYNEFILEEELAAS